MITVASFVAAVVIGALGRAEAGRIWNRQNGLAVGTLVVLSRRAPGILDRTWLPLAGRILAASTVAILAMVAVQLLGGSSLDDQPLLDVAITGVVGVAVWLAAVVALRIEGFEPIADRVRALADRPADQGDDRPRRRPPTP